MLVLILALGLTLVGTAALHDAVRTRAARRLDLRLLQSVDGIRRRVDGQVALLRSAAAFVDQVQPVNRDDFRYFIGHLELQRHFPGLQGIGYAPIVGRDELAAVEAATGADAAPGFRVWPTSTAAAMAPLVYLEPADPRNQATLGFDLLSDPRWQSAAARACASGLPAMSSRFDLPPADMPEVGFVLVVALPPLAGAVEPMLPCRGFTAASVRAADFLRAAVELAPGVRIQIHDGPVSAATLLYDSAPGAPTPSGYLRVERNVDLGGRRWMVVGTAQAATGASGEALLAPGLGLLGAITSLALFLATRSQVNARARAEAAVGALRREEAARALLLDEERAARRRSEEANAVLDTVFQAVPAGLVVLDGELRVERVNQSLAELTAMSSADPAGQPLAAVVAGLDDSVGSLLRTAQDSGAPLSSEVTIDGPLPRTLLVSVAPVRPTQGAAAGVVAVLVDISERKREEARVRRERDVAEILVELAKEMNAQLDRSALIQRLAEIARTATGAEVCVVGVDGDTSLGQAGGDHRDASTLLRDEVQPGWASREVSAAVTRGGEVLRIGIGATEVARFDAGHQAMIDGLAQQATVALENARLFDESQQLIGALARSNQALARSNRELDQFAYAASHDLKAPLRGIASLSHWIEEDLGDDVGPEARRYLELMRGRVSRLENLVDGLLRYARAGRGSTDAPVPLTEIVDEVRSLLAPTPPARIEVSGALPVVAGDRSGLEQIVMNLVGNALKHGGKADITVTVSVVDRGDHWQLSVADDGVGIAADFHERIWGMFQTLQPRDKVDSTGIGLALVRKVVEARGGRTWVASELGQGATFHVTWPK